VIANIARNLISFLPDLLQKGFGKARIQRCAGMSQCRYPAATPVGPAPENQTREPI
jgi:hypothetical protein